MRQAGVNYPKRKQKKEVIHIEGIPEPVRESIYDVMMKNFKLIDRVTFLHRIIYVGKHSLHRDQDILATMFSDIIDQVNEEYHLEKLSGFLLTYTKCFVHMVEGDEDSINKHIKLLVENEVYMQHVGTLKLLICVHHINQRFHSGWSSYSGQPSKLFVDISLNTSLEHTGRHIYNCIKKMYRLISAYHEGVAEGSILEQLTPSGSVDDQLQNTGSVEGIDNRFGSTNTGGNISLRSPSVLMTASIMVDPYRYTLPEYELVKFLLDSSYTQTLQDYYKLYRLVPQRDIYKDRVWPIPSDFVPYDVFSKPYDTIIELPRDRTEDYHTRVSIVPDHPKKSVVENPPDL